MTSILLDEQGKTDPQPSKPTRLDVNKPNLAAMKSALNTLGTRALDQRFQVAKALNAWKEAVIQDLGSEVSTQQSAVIDICVRTKMMLDSVDTWILQQPSIVNKRDRKLFPIILQRQTLADSLVRNLVLLGLKKKSRAVGSLNEFLRSQGEEEDGV
jgi:hypothetical protein